ncbi:MAG: MipA/OmpV family protein [Stenotrophobium sp.]
MRHSVATLMRWIAVALKPGAGLVISCAMLPSAQAQSSSPMAEWQYSAGNVLESRYEKTPEWQTVLGLGAEEAPRYPGASKYRFQPAPTFDIRYRDIAFASIGEGLGVNFTEGHSHRIGMAITYDLGRKERDDPHLHGLGNINPAPELKFFAEYVMFPLVLRIDIRHGFGGYNGWIGDLGAYAPVIGNDKFFLMIGPSVTFADHQYQQHYFGITQAQSANSVYAPYAAAGGLSSFSFGANATWFITDHWLLEGLASAQRMLGSSFDSPLVNAHGQYAGGLFLNYMY